MMTAAIQDKAPVTVLAQIYGRSKAEAKEGKYSRINGLINSFALAVDHPVMRQDPTTCCRICNRMIKLFLEGENSQLSRDVVDKAMKQFYAQGVFSSISPDKQKMILLSKDHAEVPVHKGLLRLFCKGLAVAGKGTSHVETSFSRDSLERMKEVLHRSQMDEVCASLDLHALTELYALGLYLGYQEMSEKCLSMLSQVFEEALSTTEKLEAYVSFMAELELPEERRADFKLGGLKALLASRGISFGDLSEETLWLQPSSIRRVQEIFSSNELLSAFIRMSVTGFSVTDAADVVPAALLVAMSDEERENITEFCFDLNVPGCPFLLQQMGNFFPNIRYLNILLSRKGDRWDSKTLKLDHLAGLTNTLKSYSALESVFFCRPDYVIDKLDGSKDDLEQLKELPRLGLAESVDLTVLSRDSVSKQEVESYKAFSGYQITEKNSSYCSDEAGWTYRFLLQKRA